MRNSIRRRLTIAFIGLAIGPLLLVGVILAWQSFTTQQRQALSLQREVAQRVSAQVMAFLEELEGELRVVSQVQGLLGLDRDQQQSVLSELLFYEDALEALVLLDSEGQEQVHLSRFGLTPTELGEHSEADEFVIPQTSGEVYYSPVRFEETTGEPLMTIAVPLLDARTGLVEGVLVSDIRIKKIWDLIADIRVSQGQDVYIVDVGGRVIAHRNPSVVLRNTTFDLPDQEGIQPGLAGTSVVLAIDTARFGEQEFNIVAEQSASEALALAINTVLITAVLVVVVLAIASGLGFLTVRQVVRPIETLATTAQAISAGDLSQQAVVTSRDEIGALAQAFNSMTAQLRGLIGSLEQRVADRTRNLQTAAEVARTTTSVLDPDELLQQVVRLVRERFRLYYVGLFLLDEERRFAVLRAGTGEAGQKMLAQGHRLEVGGDSMVGQCTGRAEAYIAVDVGEEAVRFDNPLLPETRSEMALPLRSRGRVIGAMTVQSAEEAAFDEADIAVMQTMADQVAVAIDNARLFAESQAALEAERRAYGELSQEAWARLLHAQPDTGYVSSEYGITSVEGVWPPEMEQALEAGKTVQSDGSGDEGKRPLAVPIKVRGEVIGVLDTHKSANVGEWTDEELAFLEALADQLGVALESARLYQDTQRRAERERLTSEIMARVRESLDIDTVLQTAVREIGEALGIADVEVRMSSDVATEG